MCTLQVIKKVNNKIVFDQDVECKELKKVNINNVPYYLTIESEEEKNKYMFAYLDKSDSKYLARDKYNLEYGDKSGRIYSLSIMSQANRIEKLEWNKILNDIQTILNSSNTWIFFQELKKFFMLIQRLGDLREE